VQAAEAMVMLTAVPACRAAAVSEPSCTRLPSSNTQADCSAQACVASKGNGGLVQGPSSQLPGQGTSQQRGPGLGWMSAARG